MADDNIKENDKIIKESAKNQAELLINARSLTEEISDQLGLRSRLNTEDRALLSLSRSIASSAAENSAELRRAGQLSAKIVKERKLLARVENEIAVFQARQGESFKKIEKNANKLLAVARKQGAASEEFRILAKELNDQEAERYVTLALQQDAIEDIVKQRKEELKFSDQVNNSLGIAGALIDNLDKLGIRFLGGIGLNLGIFQKGLRESKDSAVELAEGYASISRAQEELNRLQKAGITEGSEVENQERIQKEAAEDLIRSSKKYRSIQEELNKLGDNETEKKEELLKQQQELIQGELDRVKALSDFDKQTDVIKKLAPGIGQSLKKALQDPTTIAVLSLDQMIKAFTELNKASVELSRYTGQTEYKLAALNSRLATSVQFYETITEFTKLAGFNANNIFSGRTLQAATEFKNTLGLSSEEVFGLAFQAEAFGRNIDATTDQIVNQVGAFNRSNRSAVSTGVVLRDVAKASDAISASLEGNPKALAEAGAAARRLGIELNQLDQIVNSLLDFESSIEAELTAQLITGRNINLSKARELALSNDLAGVGKEIFKNSADIAEFGRMGRIEQESMAQAIGLTRDQLARTAYLRAIANGMSEEEARNAANVTKEEMTRIEVTKSLEMAMQKLAQALVGPAELMAFLADKTAFLGAVIAGIGAAKLGGLIMQIRALAVAQGAAAATAFGLSSALTLGASAITIGAGIAAMVAASKKAQGELTSIEDGVIQNGQVITTHPDDFLLATKDPRGLANAVGGVSDLSPLLRKLDQLIGVTKDTGGVYIDSNKLMQVANISGVSNYT